jgi:ribosomal protein S18 acetylase RimI-like enzyme
MRRMERLDEMLIVAPGPGDAAALAEVHVKAWRETYASLLPAPYLTRMSAPLYARRFRRQLTASRPSEWMLAAEGRDGLVGYCAGQRRAHEATAEVSTLYIVRQAQKLGLGRRLLGATARVLQARGARSLRLWVLDGNEAARGFYEHLGGSAGPNRPVLGWGGGFHETAFLWPDITQLSAAA